MNTEEKKEDEFWADKIISAYKTYKVHYPTLGVPCVINEKENPYKFNWENVKSILEKSGLTISSPWNAKYKGYNVFLVEIFKKGGNYEY